MSARKVSKGCSPEMSKYFDSILVISNKFGVWKYMCITNATTALNVTHKLDGKVQKVNETQFPSVSSLRDNGNLFLHSKELFLSFFKEVIKKQTLLSISGRIPFWQTIINYQRLIDV